jgi:hypothetical protein
LWASCTPLIPDSTDGTVGKGDRQALAGGSFEQQLRSANLVTFEVNTPLNHAPIAKIDHQSSAGWCRSLGTQLPNCKQHQAKQQQHAQNAGC